MKLGLGIDTGGTYTDAVIYDFNDDNILCSSKARTSREDLKMGILEGLAELPTDLLQEVDIVSLSTTLATNAAVENKLSRGTLILIGCDPQTVEKYGGDYGLPGTGNIIFLEGGHNQQGDVIKEPDWCLLQDKLAGYRGRTDGFALVQLWGMRNPEYEKKGKQLIKEWTGLPVVCAHELLGDLNFLKRAATALLNVRLIPIIDEFLNAIKISLREKEVEAPLVIVRGDGTLMSEEFARERPLETLLSGPAASVVGGMNLTGERDCLIVDMGGTTSDFALVNDGEVKLVNGGIDVGVWRTGTKSIDIKTLGLGGDSQIIFENNGSLSLGPQRVAPLSWLASRWPATLKKMERLAERGDSLSQFYYLVKDLPTGSEAYSREREVVSCLSGSPMTLEELAGELDCSIFDLDLERLSRDGHIMKSGLTPTDVMHNSGEYTSWNITAAEYGLKNMARLMGITPGELSDRIVSKVKQQLYYSLVEMLLENEDRDKFNGRVSGLKDLIILGFSREGSSYRNKGNRKLIDCQFSTDFSLVGIGAPVHIFLPGTADALRADYQIPEYAPVANAVGAITAHISVLEEVKIRPRYEATTIKEYICYSSEQKQGFDHYQPALDWAREEARRLALKQARERGAVKVMTRVNTVKKEVTPGLYAVNNESGGEDGGSLLLETIVSARAVGDFREVAGDKSDLSLLN